ncbi:hypothetical protein L7F22_036553 [Adiantum nelumboides]|nr:hypothetical protein [Adiantum nelumboides]
MNRISVVILDYSKSSIKSKSLCEQIQATALLHQEGCPPSRDILGDLLNACTILKDLSAAKQLHSIFINMGIHSMSYIGDHLIRMYASCGCLQDAHVAFHQVSHPSVYTWNAIISAHSHLNQHRTALVLFDAMLHQGIIPDKFTFLCTLKSSCKFGDLTHCGIMHDLIIRVGLDLEVTVMNTVVDMYAKCGALAEAIKVFSLMGIKNLVSWGALIAGCVTNNEGLRALLLFREMHEGGQEPHSRLFASLMKACGGIRAIVSGWWVHDRIIRNGLEGDVVVGSTLVDMYAKWGDMVVAQSLFDRLRHRDVVSWAALIAGYTTTNMAIYALETYMEMQKEGVKPDNHIYSAILKAASSMKALCSGMWIHDQIMRHESRLNVVIGCALVNFYGTCGLLEAALNVFDLLPERNILSWGALITCFVQEGHEPFALVLFGRLCKERLPPDSGVLACILNVCGCLGVVEAGYLVHAQIVAEDLELTSDITRSLLGMYLECGSLEDALGTFSTMPNKDEEAWGLIIRGYCDYGEFSLALDAVVNMQHNKLHTLDDSICFCTLKACGKAIDIEKGCVIHSRIIQNGWEVDAVIGSALVDMYGSCGRVEDARQVFNSIAVLDVVACGAMMAVYEQHGLSVCVVNLYQQMQGGDLKPDIPIFGCIIKACSQIQEIQPGRIVHDHVVRMRLESDSVLENIILDFYANCHCLEEAQRVFGRQQLHDAVSWSTIIAAYTHSGHTFSCLQLFEELQHEKIMVDAILLSSFLNACGFGGSLNNGMFIHDQLIKSGWESKDFVVHALIGMYGKCGVIKDAHKVFDLVEDPDENTWGQLISAFMLQRQGEHALCLYNRMQKASLIPNEATAVWILKACGNQSHIEQGMSLHSHIIKYGQETTLSVANSVLEMYAKCGKIQESSQTFIKMPAKDKVTWSTIILAGMTDRGQLVGVVQDWVAKMQNDGLHPDDAIFTSLLQACSQAGSLEEGLSCFNASFTTPTIEQYSCIIDLFGRVGRLNAAEDVMQTMPIQDDFVALTSFHNSCKTHRSVCIGNGHVDTTDYISHDPNSIQTSRSDSQFGSFYDTNLNKGSDCFSQRILSSIPLEL